MGKKVRGFTLIEMTLTVAILAVCAAVAAPVMGEVLERQRAGAAMGALATQMQLARMSAITYRQPAILCPSRDGAACDGSTDWSGGWMVFLDRDGNRQDLPLTGAWFVDGFAGAMGELMSALTEGRAPENSAADAAESVRLMLAARDSASDEGRPVRLGTGRA